MPPTVPRSWLNVVSLNLAEKYMKQLFTGARYIARGFQLIKQPGLRKFVAVPLLLNIVLFSAAIYWGNSRIHQWLDSLLPSWLSWLEWIILPIFGLLALLVLFYGFTLIANLVGAPFNAILAEKVEQHLGYAPVTQTDASLRQLLGETLRSLGSEARKLLYLAGWSLPLLLLFVIPGVNLIAPIAWALFGAWMLALEYIDYPMGNHQYLFKEERKILAEHRLLAWGFGGGILVMTMIPIVNFFAMPVGVAGATALWLEQIKPKVTAR